MSTTNSLYPNGSWKFSSLKSSTASSRCSFDGSTLLEAIKYEQMSLGSSFMTSSTDLLDNIGNDIEPVDDSLIGGPIANNEHRNSNHSESTALTSNLVGKNSLEISNVTMGFMGSMGSMSSKETISLIGGPITNDSLIGGPIANDEIRNSNHSESTALTSNHVGKNSLEISNVTMGFMGSMGSMGSKETISLIGGPIANDSLIGGPISNDEIRNSNHSESTALISNLVGKNSLEISNVTMGSMGSKEMIKAMIAADDDENDSLYDMLHESIDSLEVPTAVADSDIEPRHIKLGRGKPLQRHPGNIWFRKLIAEQFDTYDALNKNDQTAFSRGILAKIKKEGRQFWKQEKNNKGYWVEVEDNIAREKIATNFRTERRNREKEGEITT